MMTWVKIKHVNPSVAPQVFVYLLHKDFERLPIVNESFFTFLVRFGCPYRTVGIFMAMWVSLMKQNNDLHLIE